MSAVPPPVPPTVLPTVLVTARPAGTGGAQRPRLAAAAGFTLVEVLVAFAVIAAVGGALLGLQVGASRALRAAEQLHLAAALVRNELGLQRLVAGAASGPCRSALPGVGPGDAWTCEVERSCLPGPLGPCALTSIRIVVAPPGGRPLEVRSATFPALEGLP